MNRQTRIALALGAALVVPALHLVAAQPDTSTRVEASTKVEVIDLAKLADGESRVFGSGERAVTASRKGDDIAITNFKAPDGGEKTIHCAISHDTCQVITTDRSGHGTMLYVGSPDASYVGSFSGGDGDLPGEEVVVVRRGDGKGEGEGAGSTVEIPGAHVKILHVDGGAGDPDGLFLRCPEGDTTMTLKKDEKNAGYRCPKHNLVLEEVKGGRVFRKIIVEKHKEDIK